jgi:hypothetical protein
MTVEWEINQAFSAFETGFSKDRFFSFFHFHPSEFDAVRYYL